MKHRFFFRVRVISENLLRDCYKNKSRIANDGKRYRIVGKNYKIHVVLFEEEYMGRTQRFTTSSE